MINPMQMAIIKKDFRSVVFNKRLFPVLIIVPLIFTIFLPTLLIMVIHFAPDDLGDFQALIDMMPIAEQSDTLSQTVITLILNSIMPMFFTIIPIMAASVMAASSFIGEKEKRTLETLLYCPLTLRQIFQSKVWASFLLSMTVSLVSFLLMLIVVEAELLLTTGSLLVPGVSWLITILVVSPAVSLLAITLIVGGSAKSQTVEESQQRTVFLILPLLLLIVGQFTGIILVNAWYLLAIGAVFGILAYFSMKKSMRKFTYEELLR